MLLCQFKSLDWPGKVKKAFVTFGETQFLVMMVGLHIEMAFMKGLGMYLVVIGCLIDKGDT